MDVPDASDQRRGDAVPLNLATLLDEKVVEESDPSPDFDHCTDQGMATGGGKVETPVVQQGVLNLTVGVPDHNVGMGQNPGEIIQAFEKGELVLAAQSVTDVLQTFAGTVYDLAFDVSAYILDFLPFASPGVVNGQDALFCIH